MLTVIHSADWHLGQTLYGHAREAEHQQFLDWLLQTLLRVEADALLIAGDVFDVAHPSAAAQQMFYRFLLQARQRLPQLSIVVIAGNHDSGARLAAPAALLAELRIHVHGIYGGDSAADTARATVTLHDRNGAAAARVLAIPFLRPQDLRSVAGGGLRYEAAIAGAYKQAHAHLAAEYHDSLPLIAMGHLHIAQGRTSLQSERRLLLGSDEGVDSAALPEDFAYIALGHLHLAQAFGSRGQIRYSGSPLAMAANEAEYPHQVVQLQFDQHGLNDLTALPVPQHTRFVQHSVIDMAELWPWLASLPCVDDDIVYLGLHIELSAPEPDLRQRVRQALQGKGYRLMPLKLSGRYAALSPDLSPDVDASVLQRSDPTDLLRTLYQDRYHRDVPAELSDAFDALLRAQAAAP